jgi:subtilisin family serine protease
LQRRNRDNISLDSTDLPVAEKYIAAINPYVDQFIYHSKWLNASIIKASFAEIEKIEALDFVSKVLLVAKGEEGQRMSSTKEMSSKAQKRRINNTIEASDFNFQNSILGITDMHKAGYTAEGVLVAIFDAGFLNADQIPAFDHLFNGSQTLITRDFVLPEANSVFRADTHGTGSLSLMAAYDPENLIAGAYGADYILCITEDEASEYKIEEYNWVRAAEFADSLGVDVINSSLGYNFFDDSEMNYSVADMDGATAIITIGANMAAEKGIMVVSSAGNEGNISWKTITAPADAKDIIAVGAINNSFKKAGFSSIGPSSDGRIKPELVAFGTGVRLWRQIEETSTSSGTSFSAPQIAALAAGLIQANPEWTNKDLRERLLLSGSQFYAPDNELGYGVPDFTRAMFGIVTMEEDPEREIATKIYPNPLEEGQLLIEFGTGVNCSMKLYSSEGKVISTHNLTRAAKNSPYNVNMDLLNPGLYLIELQDNSSATKVKLWKK